MHPPVPINGSRSVKGRENKDFLFHRENSWKARIHNTFYLRQQQRKEKDKLKFWGRGKRTGKTTRRSRHQGFVSGLRWKREHNVMYTRRTQDGHSWAACSFLIPMASCRGTCRCMSLNLIIIVFDGLFFFSISLLASHSLNFFFFCSPLNFHCRVCHGMFTTQCSESSDVQPGHVFLFTMAYWSKPTHFKEKLSFSSENSWSLGWVITRREISSKIQRGVRMPGQRRAGQLITNKSTLSNRQNSGVWVKIKLACLFFFQLWNTQE